MDSKNSYKPIENNLQAIQQEQREMNESNPPPAYSNCQQPNASAPAQPANAFHMQTSISTPSPQIIPINAMAFPQPVGPKSMEMTCPNCHCRVTTTVRHRATAKTHISCLLLSWTCCCCCLPYCMDSCRNANHFCPMCGTYIGTYSS